MQQRLLIVEDSPALADVLKWNLRHLDCFVVDNQRDAMGQLERGHYNVLITDIGLFDEPEAGIALIEKVRDRGLSLPICAMSGSAQVDIADRCIKSGADDFLRKPYRPQELRARIDRLLERHSKQPSIDRIDGTIRLESDAFFFAGARVTPDLTISFPTGNSARLLPKQYGMLQFFAANTGQLVLKSSLITTVWGSDANLSGHSVNEYLSKLRKLYRENELDFDSAVAIQSKVGWRVSANATAVAEEVECCSVP